MEPNKPNIDQAIAAAEDTGVPAALAEILAPGMTNAATADMGTILMNDGSDGALAEPTQEAIVPAPAEEREPVLKPLGPSKNTVQDFEISSPLSEAMAKQPDMLSLPTDTTDRTFEAFQNMPNVNPRATEDGEAWFNAVSEGQANGYHQSMFRRTADRETAQWRQHVKSDKGFLTPGSPKFHDDQNQKLTGEMAVLRVRSLLGIGNIVQIPLWHSGFWISIKAPSDSAMVELNRRIMAEKINLGRATHGLAFSNSSVFFAGHIMEFAINHLYACSLKPELAANVREHISTLDIPTIAWGLACAHWPRGFPYARAVVDQTKEQNKIIREKIDIGKLLFVDNATLTPWQVSHMAQRYGNTMTAEMLKRYRDEFTVGKGRTVTLMEGCEVTYRTPNLDQYLTSGQKWVNGIVDMVDKAFGMERGDQRNDFINIQGKATNMRQFAHWVESLSIQGRVIDDIETLELTLNELGTDEELREAYFKTVKEYIEDATMSVIAIPITEKEELGDLPRFPHLLPIDALTVFFTLLSRKNFLISTRD